MADNGAERGTTIIRSGSGHTATVTRTDPDGTIHLEQHGEDHAAVTVQSGSGGRLVIDQRGASAEAEVTQDGACNATELAQAGAGNRAAAAQRCRSGARDGRAARARPDNGGRGMGGARPNAARP